jgi:four helix bundle protein
MADQQHSNTLKDYERLEVWQWAHQLTLEIYASSKHFPKEELFGLTSQLRRCSASIAANIAEGCGRSTDADFRRFLDIAYGSAAETSYYIRLAADLGYLETKNAADLAQRTTSVRRMLGSLIRKLRADSR